MPGLKARWSDIDLDSVLLSGQAKRKGGPEEAGGLTTWGHGAMIPRLVAKGQT